MLTDLTRSHSGLRDSQCVPVPIQSFPHDRADQLRDPASDAPVGDSVASDSDRTDSTALHLDGRLGHPKWPVQEA